eukprot:CAMPEP_0182442490 /NCGR_PEP_ID=MMETSP1172-20130603/1400_1 /TAXON_ID=708627 /ORGANISM="Timspurckia oligopyrenoides, Strain CCMP3278" /LENGTH=472 /DNA_ID=CAMNT_0024637381 /DNA_START=2192 /DNA_END=3610 /DNA_ORIENTATION=-
MTSVSKAYDVVIVGGGLVGAGLACMLGNNARNSGFKLRVGLIEPFPPSTEDFETLNQRSSLSTKPNSETNSSFKIPSLRTSTISPRSIRALTSCGIWNKIPHNCIESVKKMYVWDEPAVNGLETLVFDASDVGADSLAVVVENRFLRAAMFHRLAELDSEVEIIRRKVDSVNTGQGSDTWPEVVTSNLSHPHTTERNSDAIQARVLVATDGRKSLVRDSVGLPWYSHDYNQHAVVANVASDVPHNGIAYQRFLSTGPLALLPVASGTLDGEPYHDRLFNVVWSTSRAEAHALKACSEHAFVAELNNALSLEGSAVDSIFRAGKEKRIQFKINELLVTSNGSSRGVFPLQLGHAPEYVQNRVALLGDAAHAVHPLAGQGVNLGIADADVFSRLVADACSNGRDIGGDGGALLLKYQGERMLPNVMMMSGIHCLKNIFDAQWHPFSSVRSTALSIFSQSSVLLKKQLIRTAMGI